MTGIPGSSRPPSAVGSRTIDLSIARPTTHWAMPSIKGGWFDQYTLYIFLFIIY